MERVCQSWAGSIGTRPVKKQGTNAQITLQILKKMKVKHRRLSVWILALSLFTTGVYGEELLINPAFEDKIEKFDTLGWDVRGGRTIQLERVVKGSIQGAYALKVSGRGSNKWEGVKQEVNLQPGKTYRISGLMKLAPGEGSDKGVVQLVKTYADGSKKYQDLFRGDITDGGYTSFQKDFEVEERNIDSMIISVHGPEGGKSFMLDDFSLTEVK
jgi:hypothetical protein